ncbi:MAG TPA: extracellular solute-binding protein [Thermoleophilia bacterium]|nr:extracellular solute-binding protein [Thermoleophilia bacterium]HZK49441.1 extracellular solute-binding protein [Thermoleophilia bacterium]
MKRLDKELRVMVVDGLGGPMTRRGFIKRAGAAGLLVGASGFLAACGGGETTTTTAAGGGGGELAKELYFYNWSDYIAEETIPTFQDEFGVKVVYDNYSSNDTLLAKLQSGATGYDIIVPTDYMITTMLGLDLLQEIDLANVPNVANLYQRFREAPFDPGNKYSIPWQWGTTGIGYNSVKVPDFKPSWDMLWDEKYKGKITMMNEIRDVFAVALFRLGYSPNTIDPKEIEEAKQMLIAQKPVLKHYTSDTYIDELASEDSWLSHGWSGDVLQAQMENEAVLYAVPEEGSLTWVDCMCIPKGAPSKYTAEVFMNYIQQPEVAAGITNYVYYASPNEKAEEFILPEILDDPQIYPPQEVMDKLTFLEELGTDTELYNAAYQELRAS